MAKKNYKIIWGVKETSPLCRSFPGDKACAWCVLSTRGRWLFVNHAGIHKARTFTQQIEDATVRKPDAKKEVRGETPVAVHAGCLLSDYPSICQYLYTDQWDDGTSRETSQLVIGLYDGGLRIALNDRELKQSVYCQSDTVQEGLDLLEGALRSDSVRWYKWKSGKKQK